MREKEKFLPTSLKNYLTYNIILKVNKNYKYKTNKTFIKTY